MFLVKQHGLIFDLFSIEGAWTPNVLAGFKNRKGDCGNMKYFATDGAKSQVF